MYKKSVVFLFCASIFGALYCQDSRKVESCYYGQFPVQLERNLARDPGAFVQVKIAKVCLLHGLSGNGVRMTARLYAERMGAVWREVPFAVLLDGYGKFGAAHIHDFFKKIQQEAKDRKIQIVLYMSDIDGNRSGSAHIKPVLDLVRIELEELENKQSGEGDVFVMLSTHRLGDVDTSFLCHIEGSPVEVKSDAKNKLRIFHVHLFAQADARSLLAVYKAVREKLPKDSKALGVATKIDELEALLHAHEELAASFWEQKGKNNVCWFNQTMYTKTKRDIVQLFTDVHDKSCQVVKLSLAALKEEVGLSDTEKEFYAVTKNLACMWRVSGYSAKELYKNEGWTTMLVEAAQGLNSFGCNFPETSNSFFVTKAKEWRGVFEVSEL